MAKYSIARFNGGITDFIYKAGPEFSEQCDNLIITKNFGLKQRQGSSIISDTYPRITGGKKITKLIDFNEAIMMKSLNKLYTYDSSTGYTEVEGYDGAAALYSLGENNYIDYGVLNSRIMLTSVDNTFPPVLVTKSSNYEAVTLGLPDLASTPEVALTGGGDTLSYLYAFAYFREYTASSVDFEENGTPDYLEVASTAAVAIDNSNPASITSIPTLGNAADEIYDIGTGAESIKVKIYRTINNGSIFFDTGIEVTNGTATASDDMADADLILQPLMYTEGGISENDAPPTAKYVTVAKESAWYANVKEKPNRIRQSKRSQPGSCPESYYVDVEADITGIGTSRNFPIVFTEDKVYRIEGFIDELGSGDLQKNVVSDRVGCISFRSIVQTRQGIYFAARDGFYFTDGYSIRKISEQINETYKTLIETSSQKSKLNAAYNTIEEKVFFSCMVGADNDIIYVYDEVFQSWTTMTGQTDFIPSTMASIKGIFYRSDEEGYTYKFDSTVDTDPVREVGVATTSWGEEAIIYKFKHIALNFGEFDTNKWVNKITAQIKDDTGQHIAVQCYDDDSTQPVSLKPITSVGLLSWGESGVAWGESGIIWGRSYVISKTRRFPSGSLRARYKQLYITNQEDAVVQYSDASGDATVDATAKTITLGTLALAITNANAMKVTLNTHYSDYGSGTEEHIALQTVVSTADATDETSLIALVTALINSYDTHDADAELGSAWTYHQAQEGDDYSLSSVVAPSDVSDCYDRLLDMKEKLNDHEGDASAHTNGDSPRFLLTGGIWDDKIENYSIRLTNSTGGYNTEFTVSSRDSDTQITVTDASGYLTDGFQAWEVIGYKKNEVIDLQALTYTFTKLSDRGGYYNSSSDSQGNE